MHDWIPVCALVWHARSPCELPCSHLHAFPTREKKDTLLLNELEWMLNEVGMPCGIDERSGAWASTIALAAGAADGAISDVE